MDFAYPLLVCDIGGFNARFARAEAPTAPLSPVVRKKTAGAPTFEDAIEDLQWPVRSLLVSAAGPVAGGVARLTNAAWTIDARALARRFALDACLVLNDFEAQAIALPHLGPRTTRTLIAGAFDSARTQLVLGPGTGFGAAALLADGGRWRPLPSEAGHMSFGPTSRAEEEIAGEEIAEEEIWRALPPGPVGIETLLSGPGLARLHAARALAAGRESRRHERDAPGVVAAAQAGDAFAGDTLAMFWRLVARVAGDLALAFLARGGVTLSGGILPRVTSFLDADAFARTFADKGARADIAGAIPVRLMTDETAVLEGMAALAAAPERFALDYAARAFSSGAARSSGTA